MEIDCIGVGSPLVDTLARVDDAFIERSGGGRGGMQLVDSPAMGRVLAMIPSELAEAPGGSAGNTIVAMARLGDRASLLGKIGNDATGEFFKASLARVGGDTSRLKQGDCANGRCLSLITPDHERTMKTDLGAAATLSPDEVTAADFAGARHVHVEGYVLFNRDLMLRVLEQASAQGCTISVDLAAWTVVEASRDILPDLLRDYCTVVFANEDEARALFGADVGLDAAALELAKLCKIGVVKLGAKGSLIASEGKVTKVAPVLADKVVDTTGAGDYWAAGFLHGWLKGDPFERCGHLGSVLGAEIVQVIGASLDDAAWTRIREHVGPIRQR